MGVRTFLVWDLLPAFYTAGSRAAEALLLFAPWLGQQRLVKFYRIKNTRKMMAKSDFSHLFV
jgi:hypothetical protein